MLVNGVNLNVKKVGSGPPVLALHGFAGSMSTWSEFAREAQNHYTVIMVDLLGHGDSDSPIASERYSIQHSIADIVAVLAKLRISRACWMGYSMGGRIALAAATSKLASCRSLVLEGTSPGIVSPNARAQRKRSDDALASLIMEEGLEAFSNYWEQRPLFDTQRSLPQRIQDRIRNLRLRSNPIGLANTLRAAGPGVQAPVHKMLSKLKIPVLCVAGEYDYKFTAIAKQMCSKLLDGRLSIIPGAGHATHIEQPRQFNRDVLAFLRDTRKVAAGFDSKLDRTRSRSHRRV